MAEALEKQREREVNFYEIDADISPEKIRKYFDFSRTGGESIIYYVVSRHNFKIYLSDRPHYQKFSTSADIDFAGNITFRDGIAYSFPFSGTFPHPPKTELRKITDCIMHYFRQSCGIDASLKQYNEGAYRE